MFNFKKRFVMNVLKKLKLRQLTQADLAKREMNALLGGAGCCGCGCAYYYYGGSSTSGNGSANRSSGKDSPGGGIAFGFSN